MVALPNNSTNASAARPEGAASSHRFALVALTSLFFMWGFITCLNDILVPHLRNVFSLNYTQSMLIQFCFFGAYFLVSLPAGAIVRRISYKGGIVLGLVVAAIGCALFVPAASYRAYPLFLGALFMGVVLLFPDGAVGAAKRAATLASRWREVTMTSAPNVTPGSPIPAARTPLPGGPNQ